MDIIYVLAIVCACTGGALFLGAGTGFYAGYRKGFQEGVDEGIEAVNAMDEAITNALEIRDHGA